MIIGRSVIQKKKDAVHMQHPYSSTRSCLSVGTFKSVKGLALCLFQNNNMSACPVQGLS